MSETSPLMPTVPEWLLGLVTACALVGLLFAMRWGVKRLRALLSDVAGRWRPVARVLEGALVLAFALYVVSLSIGIFSMVIA